MALPTILVNSATGSDTAASGAGPGTALTGSSASTSGDGLTVTLDGSPDLSGVATDGSHVIYLADTTAGARNFGKITAKDNGAKTVTVSNAFGVSLSGKSWAIGGKRASVFSTTSRKLIENNSGNGDAMPGWTIEMESGHTETNATAITWRRAGDLTDGHISLIGTAGAATPPIVTHSANNAFLRTLVAYHRLEAFEIRNSNATKTASVGIQSEGGFGVRLSKLKISHSSSNFWKGITTGTGADTLIDSCEIGYCANVGIDNTYSSRIHNCYIHDCGSHGISCSSGQIEPNEVIGCIIVRNSGDGINTSKTSGSTGRCMTQIHCNVIHGNTGDAIEISSSSTQTGVYNGLQIISNNLTANGGYALNFSGSSVTDGYLTALQARIWNNNHSGNTSGLSNLTLTVDEDTTNNNPSDSALNAANDYANVAAGSNFMLNSSSKAKGYPLGGTLAVGFTSSTYSYVDQGPQRQEAASGGLKFHPGMTGHMNG